MVPTRHDHLPDQIDGRQSGEAETLCMVEAEMAPSRFDATVMDVKL